ncbi:hypothetical protein X777_01216 [Ooceraea biroi]|uniref:Uncharacterized protein n=1 Tax=Ooceraea biroi TaxID=2015173 RepID=A0A026WT27_OOCBI|nr:hypothetical protein X777_01216 [Ooceraea biroi]
MHTVTNLTTGDYLLLERRGLGTCPLVVRLCHPQLGLGPSQLGGRFVGPFLNAFHFLGRVQRASTVSLRPFHVVPQPLVLQL